MKIIDLTKPIQYNDGDPWFMKVKIKHKPHRKAKFLIRYLGLPSKLFPPGFIGWADDMIKKLGVHSTTHIDAPWHYGPTCEGKPAKTIDEIPLEWCFGDGFVIDMKHKEDFDPITKSDIVNFLAKESIEIKAGMIALIKTGRDKLMGTKAFFEKGTGMSKEATEYLIDQGIKVMGIDAWGWDLPLPHMIEKAKQSGDKDLFWEAHLIGTKKEYLHMEQLTNLDALPYTGFKIACFPMKIVGGSAAPARVVAMIED